MGSVTESFADLNELLMDEHRHLMSPGTPPVNRLHAGSQILISRLLKPLLPGAVRCGMGTIFDIKDRQVGPLDIVACWEAYPTLGEGAASKFLAEGVIFVLQVRNWASDDLTQFGEMAGQLKKLERKNRQRIFCGAVSFDLLSLEHVGEFLRSPVGQAVDGVLSIGHNVTIRNTQGWYGSTERVPFVTGRGAAESLKAFSLALLQSADGFLGLPFGMADYQHL